jgi:DNA primase
MTVMLNGITFSSTRPTVSTPLEWKELSSSLDPKKFTTETIIAQLEKKFTGVLDKTIATKNEKPLREFLGL